MAEFSKEYADIVGDEFYDFSYAEMLENLKNNHYITKICEGLGTIGLHNINGVYHFIISVEGDVIEYSTFLQAFKVMHNEKVKYHKNKKRE